MPTAAIPFNSQNITGVAELQAARFVPTASTVPTNGMYLSAANTVAFASNSTLRASVNSTGNWNIAAPSSGTTLSLTQGASQVSLAFTDGTVTGRAFIDSSIAFFGTSTNHGLRFQSNGSSRIELAAAGNVTINAPSSGSHTIAGVAVGDVLRLQGGTHSHYFYGDATDLLWGDVANGGANFDGIILTPGSRRARLFTNGNARIDVNTSGNVTINAASSGDELTVTGSVVATSFAGALTGDVTGNVTGSSGSTTGNAATATALQNARTINGTSFNGTANITVTASADTLTGATLPALSGVNLTALNATQLTSGTVPTARITSVETTATIDSVLIGFRSIPQSSQSANYTLVLTDSGRQILHPSGGGAGDTFTIPANSSVAYPIGTVLTFVNLDSNAVSIAITTDTLTIAGTSTTGTRTLGTNGYATAVKVTTTSWLITGVGLS